MPKSTRGSCDDRRAARPTSSWEDLVPKTESTYVANRDSSQSLSRGSEDVVGSRTSKKILEISQQLIQEVGSPKKMQSSDEDDSLRGSWRGEEEGHCEDGNSSTDDQALCVDRDDDNFMPHDLQVFDHFMAQACDSLINEATGPRINLGELILARLAACEQSRAQDEQNPNIIPSKAVEAFTRCVAHYPSILIQPPII